MPKEQKEVRDLQEGNYVMMDDVPCKITAYSTAKPGKHGSAKARVEGRGVFDDRKRSFSQPVDQIL
ncbi:MAG: translation initiation factor IF-5A, partial [Halodesulfurarchaeum sp.]|nr:translation initiation factor IF-5A [Halodesulfurarchaeum sp.]